MICFSWLGIMFYIVVFIIWIALMVLGKVVFDQLYYLTPGSFAARFVVLLTGVLWFGGTIACIVAVIVKLFF